MDLIAALDASPYADRPRLDQASGRLIGSRCPDCSALSWPSRAVCHRCGAAGLEATSLSAEGTLVSHTRCWVPRPGLEPPFVLGQVRLDDGVSVFGHVRGLRDAEAGEHVRVKTVAADEKAVPAFWFAVVGPSSRD